jgi:acetylornithine deacetylase/succinyl-diaminopimelate desuccinylase-like protein
MTRVVQILLLSLMALAQSAGDLSAGYLRDLIRLDTSNRPCNETRLANYLKAVAEKEGIPAELVGDDPRRLNFIARLRGSGRLRPLLLMAHSDVVPVDRSQWTVDPFAAVEKGGYIYGRGAEDDKQLLAAELAVLVDLKRRKVALDRDIILLSEVDEETGARGATWVVEHAFPKIDAEFALNEYSYTLITPSGIPAVQIQTAEKIPTRFKLVAHGTAGHGSLPRDDNPVLHLARAIVKLSDADEPVHLKLHDADLFSRNREITGLRLAGAHDTQARKCGNVFAGRQRDSSARCRTGDDAALHHVAHHAECGTEN